MKGNQWPAEAPLTLDRTRERFGLHPERIAADTAYGTGPMLHWLLEERAIEPRIPVWDVTKPQPGRLPNAAFTYDAEQDQMICPEGKILKTTGTISKEHTKTYIASIPKCRGCPLKENCCPGREMRVIRRSIYEHDRQLHIARSCDAEKVGREPKPTVNTSAAAQWVRERLQDRAVTTVTDLHAVSWLNRLKI